MNVNELCTLVSTVVGVFFQKEKRLRIQYRDDEGTYVTVNDETDVRDALRSSVAIPREEDLVRVCVRVDNDFTPTGHEPPTKKRAFTAGLESKRKLEFRKQPIAPDPDLLELLEVGMPSTSST